MARATALVVRGFAWQKPKPRIALSLAGEVELTVQDDAPDGSSLTVTLSAQEMRAWAKLLLDGAEWAARMQPRANAVRGDGNPTRRLYPPTTRVLEIIDLAWNAERHKPSDAIALMELLLGSDERDGIGEGLIDTHDGVKIATGLLDAAATVRESKGRVTALEIYHQIHRWAVAAMAAEAARREPPR